MNNFTSSTADSTVVLIDVHTRKVAESITYDALAKHTTVITDIRELSNAHYGCDFVFFEPAVPAIVTPELLQEYVALYGIHPHFIYGIEDIAGLFAPMAHLVKADYSALEWNLVYAVIHADLAILEPYQRTKREITEYLEVLDSVPTDLQAPINKMYTSYVYLAKEFNRIVSRNSELAETVANYKSVGRRTTAAINELKALLQDAVEENRTYCAMLSETYDVTFSGLYPERPRVLYIKTISHLSGIDHLLMVLYSALTKQYKLSCKVLKLVDSANAASIRYVPNVYVPITSTYNTEEVLVNDFIVSLGAYNIMMDLLMLNRSGLEYLIIHDMRGTLQSALDNSLIDLKLHEISGDYAVLGEYENLLTDLEGASEFVWKFGDVAKFTGTNTSKLVNHPTVTSILNWLI